MGFVITATNERGTSRQWFMGRDGVKRWADDGMPTDGSCAGTASAGLPG